MKLSICAIIGNEAVHIERFLKSFSKIADEFVIVRAIGASEPDDTLSKCGGLGIPIRIGHYYNHPDERAKWGHVDDFGAARQESFDLATGDWLAWFDADDVWPENNPENDELIRRIKAGEMEEYSRIHISYQVPDAGAMVARERFAKRSAKPKWVNPIHEEMHVEGRWFYVEQATVLHAPLVDKKASALRNLKILEFATGRPDLYGDQSTLWFYKHRELMYLGKVEESIKAADKALELLPSVVEADGNPQNSHTVLLYEILLITAGIALDQGKASEARARAHGAINVMPGRREAYAVMAQIECQERNFRKMLAYASAMRGIDEPCGIQRTWTQRDLLYSWQGAFLFHQSLRLNGQIARAEQEEENVFQLEGAEVSVIHPTMLRPDLALQTYSQFMSMATNPGAIQYIFAIDAADDYSKSMLAPYKTVICPRGACEAAEHARKYATGKRVVIIDDYAVSSKGWETDQTKIGRQQMPWKLEAPFKDYARTIKSESPRYVICAKSGNSPFLDYESQHCNYELGWEQGTTHIYAKWLLSQGNLTKDDVIVTLPGREFLYQTCFNRVITWQKFCYEAEHAYGVPYRDASGPDTLDIVERFERNGHRYDDVYFTGPNQTWDGGAWNFIQSFKESDEIIELEEAFVSDFVLLSLRKRPHESRRDTSDDFGKELLQKLHDELALPIFLVGLNLPIFGIDGIHAVSLQDFVTLAQSPRCRGILGPHSGPNGLAGLLAPKGKNILIFPMEYCPSIDSNYPTGMGKCLNLNGNIRHWMPVQSSPSDIVAKAKEIFLK